MDALLEKAGAGEALTIADRAALRASGDLLGLGMAADQVRRRRHGARITFVRVAEVRVDEPPSTIEWPVAAGEVRLIGSLVDLAAAETVIRAAADRAAGRVPLTGFSLAEVEAVAGGDRARAADVLRRLAGAGLNGIAEAPLDALGAPEAMLAAADDAGMPALRLTVGRAAAEHRVKLLDRVAALVGASGLVAFAPLPQRPGSGAPSTGFEDVRLVALARLLVDVPHIQVDWRLYGPKLAQVGLTFGADDVDGVSPLEETFEGRRRAPLEEIRRNILTASGEPAERDGLFRLRR